MSIDLVIDNREHSLINKLRNNHIFTIEQLDIGDIIFKQNNNIIFIIERKTIPDFKSSICDKRYREQKARLLNSGIANTRIMYIIEGDLNTIISSTINGFPISTLISSIINSMLRDGIFVYKTSSILETSEFIKKLHEKLEKNINNFFNFTYIKSISDQEYASTLKKKKKNNLTPNIWFINVLSQIPQVTEKISFEIIKQYDNVICLSSAYKKCNSQDEAKKLLSEIKIPVGINKQKRLGYVISERIYNLFHGIPIY
jgi:ERCC4-type nuclease